MSFNALALAKLGIGFGAKAVATLGLVSLVALPPVIVDQPTWGSSAGGSSYDGGQGYVLTEHGWVKLTKIQKVGAKAFTASVFTSSSVAVEIDGANAGSYPAAVRSESSIDTETNKVSADANAAAFSATSEVPADLVGAGMATYTARIEWLSADELLVLLDVFDNKD